MPAVPRGILYPHLEIQLTQKIGHCLQAFGQGYLAPGHARRQAKPRPGGDQGHSGFPGEERARAWQNLPI
ncbi:MAG: hypothetical protein AB1445_09860 [Bacillota bacterium]